MDSQSSRGGDQRRVGFFRELSEDLCSAVDLLIADRSAEIDLDDVSGPLWELFWDMNRGRQSGVNGWQAIPPTEMRAWAAITGNVLRPDEWQILRDMDATYMKAAMPKSDDDPADRPELTAAAFDAMFA